MYFYINLKEIFVYFGDSDIVVKYMVFGLVRFLFCFNGDIKINIYVFYVRNRFVFGGDLFRF